jgi:acetyl esterase
MKVLPEMQAWMEQMNANMRSSLSEMPTRQARDVLRALHKAVETPPADVADIVDVRLGEKETIPARLYTPYGADPTSGGLVFFHGGGFVVGNLDSHDGVCRKLASVSKRRVIAVDYRLAPEHPFPAAADDALDAYLSVRDRAHEFRMDPEKLAIGGDSAGGNLAAVVTQDLRAFGEAMPRYQMLIYPLLSLAAELPAQKPFRDTTLMSKPILDYVRKSYVPRGEEMNVRISPLFAKDFTGLPPALVVTAGVDPLQDEGRVYADKLTAAGIKAVHRHYSGEVHGFFNLTRLSAVARKAVDDAGRDLEAAI